MKLVSLSLLALVGTASAADLSSVGTTGVEVVGDYSYAKAHSTEWQSEHTLLGGLQLNAGGLGSLVAEAGDHQNVGGFRNNFTTFRFGYANGVRVGKVGVAGEVAYGVATGDVWFPLARGKNHDQNLQSVQGTAELNVRLTKTVLLFTDYTHTYGWSSGTVDAHSDSVVGGVQLNLGSVSLKAGLGRDFTAGPNSNLGVAQVTYKF